ncbi:hypothetical protein ACEWY4_003440 [Coilia grayii]|uniref:Interleukin-21 receptor n=1 Tax=Coilia grayii TaxID=363190 RepID=A0ABD1KR86_9TELE
MAVIREALTLVSFLGLIHCSKSAANVCEVACTTDYISEFNCSKAEPAPVASCLVEFQCRIGEDQMIESNDSCEIRQSDHWCAIRPDDFEDTVTIDTNCTIRVKHKHHTEVTQTVWPLKNFVKPKPPFNVTLEESGFDFNLTWSMAYTEEHFLNTWLIYRVRLRPHGTKESIYYDVTEDRRFQIIQKENLVKGETYVIDVQAAVNPALLQTIWSDWSPTSQMMTKENVLDKFPEWYFFLLLMMIPVVLIICTKMWASKLHFSSIPNPRNFFKPLYHTYEGDFKRWVGPVLILNSFELQEKSPSLKVMSTKGLGKETETLCNGLNMQGSRSRLFLQDPNYPNSLCILDNTIPDTDCSAQHISIDTVTVSEEGSRQIPPEASELQVIMQEEESIEHWLHPQQNLDMEQISLDSFGSLEYSEDGYPRVKLDLDTVDSGFLESNCSSPVFDQGEQIETDALHIGGFSHSSYVKQWVAHPGQ